MAGAPPDQVAWAEEGYFLWLPLFLSLALALRHSSRAFSWLGGTPHPGCPPPCPVPQRCQMGWSKAARPDSVLCSIPPRPLGSQEEGLAGQQMVGWEEGLPGRRTTVRTDGELGRGLELTHLLLPLQGLFSAPPAGLGWVHLTRSGSSTSGSVLVFPAQSPLGVSEPLLAASSAWMLSAGGHLRDLGDALAEHVAHSRTKPLW